MAEYKNIIVVGGSYVGITTADELVKALPAASPSGTPYRVLVVEKHSHFEHLFAFPRFALTKPGLYEHGAFIPFDKCLSPPHAVVRAAALRLNADKTLSLDRPAFAHLPDSTELPYEALVMATGTQLSPPGTVPGETKAEGIAWFNNHQERVAKAERIVIVGGGAVGVQMAADLPLLFPGAGKKVTLVHSRENLMPRFHTDIHKVIVKRLGELGVETLLGSRAKIPQGGWDAIKNGGKLELEDGRSVEGDLIILATGQTPLSGPLAALAPGSVAANGFIKVKPSLQVDAPGLETVFAVGDIADSGAPKAARPALAHAAIVARNVAKILSGSSEAFESYTVDPAAIHLTLGLAESIVFRNPPSTDPKDPLNTFVGEPTVMWKDDGAEDMNFRNVWARRAPGVTDYHL